MKLKKGIDQSNLSKYGFIELTEEYREYNNITAEDPLYYFKGYVYQLGHSRRGQFYYLLCSYEGDFSLFASKPDGDGGILVLAETDDIFFRLISDKIVCSWNSSQK